MKRFSAISLATVLTLSLTLVGCGAGSQQTASHDSANKPASKEEASKPAPSVQWIANSVWPDNNHISETLKDFSAKVKEATGGKVTIDVKTGGALGYKGPELLKAVRDDIVPVSDILLSGVAGDEPLFGVSTLPFLYRNLDEAKTFCEVARPYYDKVAEQKWNQKILYLAPWPISGFWTKNEVKSLDDLKGLKMRTFDEMGARVVKAVGGTPYPLPFSEVYSSLATGVIDSVMTSPPTAVDAKFWEVLKYYVPVSVAMGNSVVTVNLNEFNKLDKATQDAVVKAGKDAEAAIWDRVKQIAKDTEAEVNKNGIKTIQPSDQLMNDLTTLTEGIRQDWLKQAPPEAQEIVNKFKEKVGRK